MASGLCIWGCGCGQSFRAQPTENQPKSLGKGREGLALTCVQVTLALAPSRIDVNPLCALLWGFSITVVQKCLP